MLDRLLAAVARRPGTIVLATLALAVAGASLAALTLRPEAGTQTLVSRGSDAADATERAREAFGDDAIVVLVRGDLTQLLGSSDLGRLLTLEGCLSGNVPRGAQPPGGPRGPCAQLAKLKPARVVYGPGTFVNEAVRRITDGLAEQQQAARRRADRAQRAAERLARAQGRSRAESRRLGRQARQLVDAEFQRDLISAGVRFGLRDVPRIDDPNFVNQLVFDATKRPGTPKPRFAYLFPRRDAALVSVRLQPGLSDQQRSEAVDLVRAAVAMPEFRFTRGAKATVTGVPAVVDGLSDAVSRSVLVLLAAALVVMAAVLLLAFRARLRLLPLGVAVIAAALAFGALALVGAPLTVATLGVIPVLIGLAVDYAIQVQARATEAGRVLDGARRGVPTVATAAAATAAGFLVLLLSPVPMVQGFGALLVVGIGFALAVALTFGVATMLLDERGTFARGRRLPGAGAASAAVAGAQELVRENRAARAVRGRGGGLAARVVALGVRRPGRVLAVGAVVAVVGLAVDWGAEVETDVTRLVPQDLAALEDLRELQEVTGQYGQVDVVVRADDVADPRVIEWMTRLQDRALRRAGAPAGAGGAACGRAELCASYSLPDLFRNIGARPSPEAARELLEQVPAYFSQAVVTGDRRTALLSFGVKLLPLDRQQQVFERLREDVAASRPPSTVVDAQLAGLPVLTAEANDRISSPVRRLGLLLAGLVAVSLVLLAILRSARRALVPLVPVALATGWSALVLFVLQIPLNPMSVMLAALVVAISTEFSVLLAERFRVERLAGAGAAEALERTYRSTGAAVVASGVTAIAGFAVLVLSDIRMLRDFGIVTVVNLTVTLVGVLVVLPAALVLAERRAGAAAARDRAREGGGSAAWSSRLRALRRRTARGPA